MTDGTGVIAPCWSLIWASHPDSAATLDEAAVDAVLRDHPDGGGLWLHLDLVDTRTQAFLATLRTLPAFAPEALLERAETTHLDIRSGILFGAVPDFHHEAEDEPDPRQMGLLTMTLTPGLLVTARRQALRAADRQGRRPMPAGGPAARRDALLREVLDGVARGATAMAARLDVIEDELLGGKDDRRATLAPLRRAARVLHRRIEPLVIAYEKLAKNPPEWFAGAGHSLPQMGRRLQSALRSAQALQERGRIAQDGQAALVAEEANRRLLVLSILTAVLLPPSLIAGIFGMNVSDLPATTSPGGFWWALAAIIGSGAGVLALMSRLCLLGSADRPRRR